MIRPPSAISALVGVATLILVAAFTHLVAILLIPTVATRDAYDLLFARKIGTGGGMTPLAPARPGDTLIPFRDPDAAQGLCFFDLARAPVRVRTTVAEGRLLTLSFRTREGRIFYSTTDRAASRGTIDIRLVTPAQLEVVTAGDAEDAGLPEELRLKAPAATGLLVATALIARPSDRTAAEASIRAITCAPEPFPAPPP